MGTRTKSSGQHQHPRWIWGPLLEADPSPSLVVWWGLALAPPCLDLHFIRVGILVLEQATLPHRVLATLVGPAQLRGMVLANVDMVSRTRPIRHTAASATCSKHLLGCT